MASKKKRSYRYERDLDFAEYMQEAWPEHSRRILDARRAAPFVKFYYPLVGFLFSTIIAGGLTLFVTVLARQDAFWQNPETSQRIQWIHSIVESAVPVMWVLTVVVVLIVLMSCLSAGLAKSRELLFDAEKLEMSARLEYMLGGGRMRPAETEMSKSKVLDIPVSDF